MNKKNYPAVHPGSSLMMTVFIILCLTLFATLSLSTALKDYDYSEKAAVKARRFYQADAEANQKLAEIAALLRQIYEKAPGEYSRQKLTALEQTEGMTLTETESPDKSSVTYEVPVNRQMNLRVTLRLHDPLTIDSDYFTITEWREVSASDWEGDDTLPVLGSDS